MAYILGFIAADGVIQKKINVLVYHKRKLYFRRYLRADLLNQNKHYRVILSGRKSIQLFSNWIYKDKDIYLHRKYEVFQKENLSLDQLQDRKLKQTQTAVKQRKQNFLKEYMKNKCSATACSNLK